MDVTGGPCDRPLQRWEGVQQFSEWDVLLSPVAKSRPLGIGLLVKDDIAVEEEVLEQTYEGRPYEYPLVRVFEIGDGEKIRRLRVCFDKLGIEQQVAMQYPGVRGWLFKRMINFIVAQGEKGLRRPCSSTAPLPPASASASPDKCPTASTCGLPRLVS